MTSESVISVLRSSSSFLWTFYVSLDRLTSEHQSCMRCITARRICGGYEDGANRTFRQFDGLDGGLVPFKSMARKCSLPVRVSGPGTDILPEDGQPKEVSDEKVEEFSLRAFFYDYCIVSMNRSLSRGYLDGLELMLHHLGWHSDLAKACKVVAFANHGINLCRPVLTRKAEILYHDLLGSLAKAIQNPGVANNAESLMIAMLLGLYEVGFSPNRSNVISKTDIS